MIDTDAFHFGMCCIIRYDAYYDRVSRLVYHISRLDILISSEVDLSHSIIHREQSLLFIGLLILQEFYKESSDLFSRHLNLKAGLIWSLVWKTEELSEIIDSFSLSSNLIVQIYEDDYYWFDKYFLIRVNIIFNDVIGNPSRHSYIRSLII
jgi:hypothetical protein